MRARAADEKTRAGAASRDRPRRRGDLVIPAAGEFEDAVELRRIGRKVGILLEIENETLRRGRERLRRWIIEDVFVGGKKLRLGFALAGCDSQPKSCCGWLEDSVAPAGSAPGSESDSRFQISTPGPSSGSAVEDVVTIFCATSNSALPGMQTSRQTSQSTLAWRTAVPASPIFDISRLEREQNLILIAEIHQRPKRQPLWRRKLQWPSGDSLGQRPLNMRRLAGIAGILPINVPTGLKLEVETALIAAAGSNLGFLEDQLHMKMRSVGGARSESHRW